ncbi:protein kinase domain-containing protein [Streptomyces coryli]|uniref:protein kinase domain-containing protein n=1 Tax=Streptomyces coryli TaxID=1128680 RepID=UPI0019D17C96|nr:protein kinase [Streptomyces coryli]
MRGRRLNGRYELLELLGSGGMGEVWRARDHELGREVAVKVLLPERADADPGERAELLARFRREARAAAGLDSPYIVAVHDHGMDGGSPYLVMALVDGRTLQQVLRERGRVPAGEALGWAADVCRALVAAHAAGVVHRDIKPANVMVPANGGPAKVVDFGIARFTEARAADARLTQTGQLPFGSVAYLAPERFREEAGDGRADVYALGCVLYELLVGRPPFTGPAAGVMYNHLHDEPLRPSRARRELPVGVDRLVLDLMAKAPVDRPADAAVALGRIEEVAAAALRGGGALPVTGVAEAEPEPERGPEPERAPEREPEPAPPADAEPAPAPARRAPVSTGKALPQAQRPSRSRGSALAAIALVLLLPVIIMVVALGADSSSTGVTGAPADAEPPPPTKSPTPPKPVIAIPTEFSAYSKETGKVRARVVRAALKEAERRSGTELPGIGIVTVSASSGDNPEHLLEEHPGMLAMVGHTADFAGGDGDLSGGMAVMDTCTATGSGQEGAFGLRAPEHRVGKLAGRYLAARHGVRKVLIGSENYWATDRDRDRLGHGLSAAGVLAEDTLAPASGMGAKDLLQELGLKDPDAVTLADLPDNGQSEWPEALRKRSELQILHSVDDDACTSPGSIEGYAGRAAALRDGALRFRPFRDETQPDDCAAFPKLCKPGPELKQLLKHRGTAELYDGTLAIADGLIRVAKDIGTDPHRNRTALRDAVARAEFDGLLGHYDFADHRDAARPVWVDRLENGKWRQLGSLDRLLGDG